MTRRLKRTGQVAGGWGDSTHRPLGIPQGRWGLLGTTPRRESGRQPGSRGVGPAEGSPPGQGQPGWGGTPAECTHHETLFRVCLPAGAATDVPEGGRLSRHKGLAGTEAAFCLGLGFSGRSQRSEGGL